MSISVAMHPFDMPSVGAKELKPGTRKYIAEKVYELFAGHDFTGLDSATVSDITFFAVSKVYQDLQSQGIHPSANMGTLLNDINLEILKRDGVFEEAIPVSLDLDRQGDISAMQVEASVIVDLLTAEIIAHEDIDSIVSEMVRNLLLQQYNSDPSRSSRGETKEIFSSKHEGALSTYIYQEVLEAAKTHQVTIKIFSPEEKEMKQLKPYLDQIISEFDVRRFKQENIAYLVDEVIMVALSAKMAHDENTGHKALDLDMEQLTKIIRARLLELK